MEIAADESPEQNENEEIIRQMHKDAKEILSGRPKRFPELTEKKKAEVIDMTPSWHTVADIIVMLMEDGTPKGKEEARGFLYDMAKVADAYVAEKKAEATTSKRGIEEG